MLVCMEPSRIITPFKFSGPMAALLINGTKTHFATARFTTPVPEYVSADGLLTPIFSPGYLTLTAASLKIITDSLLS